MPRIASARKPVVLVWLVHANRVTVTGKMSGLELTHRGVNKVGRAGSRDSPLPRISESHLEPQAKRLPQPCIRAEQGRSAGFDIVHGSN